MLNVRWTIVLPGAGLLLVLLAAFFTSTYHIGSKTALLGHGQDLITHGQELVTHGQDLVTDAYTHVNEVISSDLYDHIDNATLGFQKIFVLNLPARTDNKDVVTLAASLTGLEVEFIPGVTEVSAKSVPPGADPKKPLTQAELGNWRAHMNAAQYMIQHNIQSALILEDDADWDIRIKKQMKHFAQAARLLIQPKTKDGNDFLDKTYPRPKTVDEHHQNFFIHNTTATSKPIDSPYGDLSRWDLFWLGHCGTHFPSAKHVTIPIGRAVILDDETVPQQQHVKMQFGDDDLITEYPAHTRVVTRARQNLCSLGYALSLKGARRLLYELSVHKLTEGTDVSIQNFCDGDKDRPTRRCYTVQPQLFQHHRPRGNKAKFSDISGHGDDFNEQAFTRNVRWSTRLNFRQLVDDETDYTDLFQDDHPYVDYGWG